MSYVKNEKAVNPDVKRGQAWAIFISLSVAGSRSIPESWRFEMKSQSSSWSSISSSGDQARLESTAERIVYISRWQWKGHVAH